jgi:hypothetical protein
MADNIGVDVFVSELETGSNTSSGVYPFLPLRDEITDLGVDTGDQLVGAYEEDEDEVQYISYEPYTEDGNSRYAVNIQSRSDRRFSYHLSVNAEYLSNPDSPFYEKEPGDRVVVELDRGEKELRAYDPVDHEEKGIGEGYKLRHSPGASPFILDEEIEDEAGDGDLGFEYSDGIRDVSAKTAFDGEHFSFCGVSEGSSDTDLFTMEHTKVSLFWDPEPDVLTDPNKAYSIQFSNYLTFDHDYTLPKKGAYRIEAFAEESTEPNSVRQTWRWEGDSWLAYDESGSLDDSNQVIENWYSPHSATSETDDSVPRIYIPVKRSELLEEQEVE